ncbi:MULTISPECIES: flagellar hook-associated protein FlgL [Bacillaceae]|uniref:flagellar hook-associated protein FlgL n=1 Tax=Bacillaceae TaxID=186817 RepID=UPI0021557477|nr:flagellar hook-associated protein FlgL [Bacillus infantis]MCR6612763.1 flagellar hook-associated protein FlgL [Bacillus infantis]MDW2876650.1 flagellar hook-associated protein FlgL [Bacillus infantis]
MRVTQSMLSSNMLSNLGRSFDRLSTYQDQISSQKKITRPSDDPVVAMKGITYRRNLQEVQQFKRNFTEAYNWTDNSDASLDKAGQAMQRIRELVVQASSDTYDGSQRDSISQEISQLKQHLAEIANTKVGDKYIFNGTNTLNKPVDIDADPAVVSNNTNPVQIELSKGVYISVNVNPADVFSTDMFKDIQDLINGLEDPASDGNALNSFLGKVDSHLSNITNARSDLGARVNRIELMEERVDQQEIISQKVMSDNEDIDFEKVVTELLAQESAHRAALSVGSRIIQPTLMDFLR